VLHRKDMETMVKRLGSNIQNALNDIQNNIKLDLEQAREENEIKLLEKIKELEAKNLRLLN
jgi:hypothetical protein